MSTRSRAICCAIAADAEDAAQECYLRAFRHFETFRGGPIKPWLLAILRNVCRAEYARRGALAAVDGQTSTKPKTMPTDLVERGVSIRRRRKPCIDSMARTMQRLDARNCPLCFAKTIVLREVNDLSYREIADVIGRAGRHGDVAACARARAVARMRGWRRRKTMT